MNSTFQTSMIILKCKKKIIFLLSYKKNPPIIAHRFEIDDFRIEWKPVIFVLNFTKICICTNANHLEQLNFSESQIFILKEVSGSLNAESSPSVAWT